MNCSFRLQSMSVHMPSLIHLKHHFYIEDPTAAHIAWLQNVGEAGAFHRMNIRFWSVFIDAFYMKSVRGMDMGFRAS